MRLFRTAICAVLIAMTPLAAAARWTVHVGHRHAGHYRSSLRLPRHLSRASRLAEPRRTTCGTDAHDLRGRLRRCSAAKAAFKRDNPCPSTGRSRGPCPGYVIDHIVPLKRGGADDPSNMQWQTIDKAKAKDEVE